MRNRWEENRSGIQESQSVFQFTTMLGNIFDPMETYDKMILRKAEEIQMYLLICSYLFVGQKLIHNILAPMWFVLLSI